MKVRNALQVSLITVITSVASADTHHAAPIIEYGFEGIPRHIPNWGAGYKGSYKPATGWKEDFSVTLDKEDPHSGLACMKIEFSDTIETAVRVHSPSIPIKENLRGTTIRVEAYVRKKNIADKSIGLGILQKDAESKTIGFVGLDEMLTVIPSGEDWQKISVEGKLNTRTTSILLMLTTTETMQQGDLWIDDILILPLR